MNRSPVTIAADHGPGKHPDHRAGAQLARQRSAQHSPGLPRDRRVAGVVRMDMPGAAAATARRRYHSPGHARGGRPRVCGGARDIRDSLSSATVVGRTAMTPYRIIENTPPLAIFVLACAALLLAPDVWSQSAQLPQPPTISGATVSASSPTTYLIGAIKYIITIAFVILALFAIGSFGGGLISELNNARERGQWGKFGIYAGCGLLVIVVVLFAGWWGGTIITKGLT